MLSADIINEYLFDSENNNAIKSFVINKQGTSATDDSDRDFGVGVSESSELFSSNGSLDYASSFENSVELATAGTDEYVESLEFDDGYTGYLLLGQYLEDTSGGDDKGYLDVKADKDDKITVVAVASEETTIRYALLDNGSIPSDASDIKDVTVAKDVESGDLKAYVFYFTADDADETNGGMYRIYSEDGDLDIARVYRDSDAEKEIDIDGTISGLASDFDTTGLKVVFTNEDDTSDVQEVTAFTKGTGEASDKYTYTVTLTKGETYMVTVEGADDYILSVDGSADKKITAEDNITVDIIFTPDTGDDTATLSGKIIFVTSEEEEDSEDNTSSSTPSESLMTAAISTAISAVLSDAVDTSEITIVLEASSEGGTNVEIDLDELDENGNYDVELSTSETYSLNVSGPDDYDITMEKFPDTDAISISDDVDGADITITLKEESSNDPTPTPPSSSTGSTHILNLNDVPTYKDMSSGGDLTLGDSLAVGDYFTIYYNASGTASALETTNRDFGDYKTERGIRFRTGVSIAPFSSGVKFTTTMPANVTVYWNNPSSSNMCKILIKDAETGEDVASTDEYGSGNVRSVLELSEAGTYILGGSRDIRFCRMDVIEGDGGEKPIRSDWSTVEPPEITDVVVDEESGIISVTVKGVVNPEGDGADSVTVGMYIADHIDTIDDPQPIIKSESKDTTTGDHLTTLEFSPSSSGTYAFKAFLSRKDAVDADGEVIETYEDKTSDYYEEYVEFNLPLIPPVISTLMNLDKDEDGKGGITVAWNDVAEADYYKVYAKDENGSELDSSNTEGTSAEITGLAIGSTVYVTVVACRETAGEGPDDESEPSEVKSIVITGEVPKAYIMDAEDLELASLDAGTKLGTDEYFTLNLRTIGKNAGSATVKNASTGNYIEINKYGTTGITFTVYGESADASFTVASTGSSNKSAFGLVNSDGVMIEGTISGTNASYTESKITEEDTGNKGIAYFAYGTTTSIIEYKDLPAGTYTFLSPYTSENRGGRVHSIVVYDNGTMPERGDWDIENIGTPEISEIKYVKGDSNINVTASGYIGYDGANSLIVEMLDSTGTVVDSKVNAADSTFGNDGERRDEDLEFTFTPKASDNYSFRANLVRNGVDNITMSDPVSDWTVKDFVLPLDTPSVKSMTNLEYSKESEENLGSLEVVYEGVDEADYYVIAAFSDSTKLIDYFDIEAYEGTEKLVSEKDVSKEYTVTLEGLPLGSCYVTVQAFRNTDSTLNLNATTTTITRNEETGKSEELIVDNSVNTTDNGFAIAVVRSKAYTPTASKYINGKNDTRWAHAVFGSNTSYVTYSRPAGLTTFDGETKSINTVPVNGYYEEVYDASNAATAGKDPGDLKSVTIWSENGRGKVVPASTDGLSYYYTTIDPSVNNFTLSALIHVKSWQYSNGQDGFGMMVSDTIGKDGDDSDFWTNSYQLLASKIQYSWRRATDDGTPGSVTDAAGNGSTVMRYEMKLGVGWNSKEGATASDLAKIAAGTSVAPANFSTNSGTLETSAGNNDLFTGSYNVIGNVYNTAPESSVMTKDELLTDLRFQIQKYDNAYVLRYLEVNATDVAPMLADLDEEALAKAYADPAYVTIDDTKYLEINGTYYKVLGDQVFSDDNNNKLTQIDKNNIYVGFFAARYARIGVSDIDLELTAAGDGDYAIPTTYVDPSITISSMDNSNSENYDLIVSANFDGTMTIYKETEGSKTQTLVTSGKEITAGTKYTFTSKLSDGKTKFICYAKPNDSYVPGENQALSTFDMQEASKTVTYHAFDGDEIYVAPNGDYIGTSYPITVDDEEKSIYAGYDADHPTNIYDAVNYASAGQTIILAGGRYDLTKDAYSVGGKAANLLIGKKHDGTAKSYITMKAAEGAVDDENGYNRPILDFGQTTQENDTAFTIAGNYWYLEGFDVIGSQDGQKGILLAGSHNILSDLRTYLNGNTGIQIARYGSDGRADWPSYNTVLNCSSFMNYDAGYEDADGFAAKLTCGDGNQFIGCISAYNADDGWDLYAKVESGSIGVVTIDRCLSFMNGYLFGIEDYYGSGSDLIYRYVGADLSKYTKNTTIVSAGNGNGFKMGGDSMSGYHVLKDSITFGNKSKGIDSNSCPDIQVYNTISFDNEANNVALYTGAAVNTDYYVENLISIKDSSCRNGGMSTTENISMRGTQNPNKIYSESNYYWSGSKSVNVNGDVFDTSEFDHMSMTTAIFGSSTNAPISRSADGSIVLNGFLERNGENNIGSSNPDEVLDMGADIYVFASQYCNSSSKLADIKLSAYAATKALSDAGYNWTDDTISTAVYAGASVDFTVTNGTSERSVTVNFIQLNGAELRVVDGDDDKDGILDADETWTVEAVPVILPAVEPDVALSGFTAEVKETSKSLLTLGSATVGTVNKNLNVANAHLTVSGKGTNGNAKMTATVSLTVNNKTVKQTATLEFTVSDGTGIKFDTIDPEPSPTSDQVRWTANSDYIQVAMNTMTGKTFTMKNLHFTKVNAEGEEVADSFGKGVTIKVNDTSVIKLKSTTSSANGVDATFTVVNKSGDGGTATVTVTSKNDKSLVRNYIVTVSGSEFAWNAGTVTIDKAKTAGTQLTAVAPFDQSMDNVVDNDITVAAVYKGTKVTNSPVSGYDKYFEAVYKAGSVYELNTTEAAVTSLPKGTYTVVYQATVKVTEDDGNSEGSTEEDKTPTVKTEQIKFTPITIKVTETKPTVTFKQTKKVNLFYNNGTDGSTGKLTATSKLGAVTVTASASDYFRFTNNGAGYDIVSISKNPVSLKANGSADYTNLKKNNKVTLTAHVDGYWSNYDVTKSFSVGLEYKQPKLKLTALDKTIYTAIGMDGADILIYDPDLEMYLNPDSATIELVTDKTNKKAYSNANAEFTLGNITSAANSGNGVRLSVNSNTKKGGAVKLSIKYSDWFSDAAVIVNQSIKVTDKVPKLTIKAAKLNINTAKFVGKEQVASSVLLNGATNFTIDDITLTGANDKANNILKYIDYEVTTDTTGNKVLLVNLKDDGTFPATADSKGVYKMNSGYPSSYSFKATYKLGSVEQTANFKLSLVSKEKLTVSVSGSIDIIDRANSTVTLKPKMTNFTPAQVSSVSLSGDAASLFTITEFDKSTGAMIVQAKDTADLKKGSYKVYPVYTFDLGISGVSGTATMTTDKPVVIKTKQSTLKIGGLKDALEVKLSSTSTTAQRTITVAPSGAYITDITQTSGLENFTLTYTGDGVQVNIKNRAGLKEGKTYKITATLTVEGGGSNVKKQTISIPVKVIR